MISEDFVIPKWVKIEDGATDTFARFAVEPFERGYGTTVGNSMRRVLLASLSGAAVTALRIEQITHEFSAIPGVKEDLTDVVLNLKKCELSLSEGESLIFTHVFKGEGVLTAADLFRDQESIACHNPEFVLLESTAKNTELEIEIKVAKGRGYVTTDKFELEHAPLGTVYLDANFSPISKVNFYVEDARVGQTTDYDRLILEVWGNGAIKPEDAVREAADLLIDHMRIFSQQKTEEEEAAESAPSEDTGMMKTMSRPVEELELSVRAANCLRAAEIKTIGELVSRSEPEMLAFHNFGKKSLDEIKAILESMGLGLGMDIESAAAAAPVESAATEAETVAAEEE
ncbi:MAG: DNA-directed RNA polymerase subunit alpha [Candidatus Hydrogenedentota bacterium]